MEETESDKKKMKRSKKRHRKIPILIIEIWSFCQFHLIKNLNNKRHKISFVK